MNRRVFATITGSRTVVVQPGQEAAVLQQLNNLSSERKATR